MIKNNAKITVLDTVTGSFRRWLLKECSKPKVASAADVAAAAAAELLAELEAQAQRAQPNAKEEKKKNAKHKQTQQLQLVKQQPRQNNGADVINKADASVQLIFPVVPAPVVPVPCELSASSSQVEPPAQLSKHSSPAPPLERSSKPVTLMRPTPIVTNSKAEAPPCTVLANSTQTAEGIQHQTTICDLRMRLEAEH